MQTCELDIDGILFNGVRIPTQNGTILLIQGRTANLGCGYFATATAGYQADRRFCPRNGAIAGAAKGLSKDYRRNTGEKPAGFVAR